MQDELQSLEAERQQLREELGKLGAQAAEAGSITGMARHFFENWRSVAQILEQATAAEKRAVARHYLEVVEMTPSEKSDEVGVSAMRLFSGPVSPPIPGGQETNTGPHQGDPVLTEDALVLEVDEKAPRQGLEPWTRGLTVRCSTD